MRTDAGRRWARGALLTMSVTAACTGGRTGSPAPMDHPLASTASRDGVAHVDVRGRDGRLTVRPTMGDSVVVRVELSRSACGAIAEPRTLHASRGEGRLRLEVTPSTNDVCDEHWIVDLPAGVGIVARFDRAEVDLRVRDGGIRISVGKGDIVARAEGGGYGRLRLAAEVGRVELVVDGRAVHHPRAPGPGDWVALEGAGGPEIVLETTVGNVRLRTGT